MRNPSLASLPCTAPSIELFQAQNMSTFETNLFPWHPTPWASPPVSPISSTSRTAQVFPPFLLCSNASCHDLSLQRFRTGLQSFKPLSGFPSHLKSRLPRPWPCLENPQLSDIICLHLPSPLYPVFSSCLQIACSLLWVLALVVFSA